MFHWSFEAAKVRDLVGSALKRSRQIENLKEGAYLRKS